MKYLAARWRDQGIKRLRDIPARNFDEAVAVLEAKRKRPRKPATLDELLAAFQNGTSELAAVMRRALEREKKTGVAFKEAWFLAIAERLAKASKQWSRELLELTARALLEEYEPKLKAEWESQPEHDRRMIDHLAMWLKTKGYRNPRTEAEKAVAKIQGVSVAALRQRRYRPRGSRRQQKA